MTSTPLAATTPLAGEESACISDFEKLDVSAKSDDESVTEKKEQEDEDDENKGPEQAPARTNHKTLHRKGSGSFMRVHDLDIPEELHQGGHAIPSTMLHESMRSQSGRRGPDKNATASLFFVDQDLKLVLDQLTQRGFSEVTDESARFTPGRETAKILTSRQQNPSLCPQIDPDWPFRPWHASSTRDIRDILIWNGMVKNTSGFGSDWPMVKARGIIPATPRQLLEFLWNSSNVKQYNTMSQGREDGTVFQDGFDTRVEDSPYGFPGCAKILKSYNKIKMVPRIIEIISILHARPLEPPLAAPGTYIMVNRSIWEGDSAPEVAAVADSVQGTKMVRSEMLLAVQLLRPICGGKYCEMTTITHALAPGLNKTVAKTAANVSAAKILRDIQTVYLNKR